MRNQRQLSPSYQAKAITNFPGLSEVGRISLPLPTTLTCAPPIPTPLVNKKKEKNEPTRRDSCQIKCGSPCWWVRHRRNILTRVVFPGVRTRIDRLHFDPANGGEVPGQCGRAGEEGTGHPPQLRALCYYLWAKVPRPRATVRGSETSPAKSVRTQHIVTSTGMQWHSEPGNTALSVFSLCFSHFREI